VIRYDDDNDKDNNNNNNNNDLQCNPLCLSINQVKVDLKQTQSAERLSYGMDDRG